VTEHHPSHLPSDAVIARLAAATRAAPVPILMSGCLGGLPVGVDGSTNGEHPMMEVLKACDRLVVHRFCPEDFGLGTPRPCPDIQGGDGFDVLEGRARVYGEAGQDLTEGMIRGALAMAEFAQARGAALAVLMDISAACGTQVIYDGPRTAPEPVRQVGRGVAAAALIRAGIPVMAQRDYKTLRRVFDALDLPWTGPAAPLRDHHETDWYRETFGPYDPSTERI